MKPFAGLLHEEGLVTADWTIGDEITVALITLLHDAASVTVIEYAPAAKPLILYDPPDEVISLPAGLPLDGPVQLML
jgi:hypothetical protein